MCITSGCSYRGSNGRHDDIGLLADAADEKLLVKFVIESYIVGEPESRRSWSDSSAVIGRNKLIETPIFNADFLL